jgi:hypothetical protein
VPICGPFAGQLDNRSASIELDKPDPVQLPPHPDAGLVPYILVEKVKYEDRDPWPPGADGNGQSLHRFRLDGYANDPTNWFGAPPTAGSDFVPPGIVRSPASTNVLAGATVYLSVTATGSSPSYLWRHDGTPVPLATNATLVLTNVQSPQAGAYVTVVTNALGAVTSAVASITVVLPPKLSPPTFSTNGAIRLTLQGTAGHNYRLDASTNLVLWTNLITLSNTVAPIVFTDPAASNFVRRFYRATLLWPGQAP